MGKPKAQINKQLLRIIQKRGKNTSREPVSMHKQLLSPLNQVVVMLLLLLRLVLLQKRNLARLTRLRQAVHSQTIRRSGQSITVNLPSTTAPMAVFSNSIIPSPLHPNPKIRPGSIRPHSCNYNVRLDQSSKSLYSGIVSAKTVFDITFSVK